MDQGTNFIDVLVVGGGVAGLATASAIKLMGQGLRVSLWDGRLKRRSPPQRVSAISAGSKRLLERLGVWRSIADEAQPVSRILIADSELEEPIRAIQLEFNGRLASHEACAYIVPNAALETALEACAVRSGVEMANESFCEAARAGSILAIISNTGRLVRASLVVGADGTSSHLRKWAKIPCFRQDYLSKAIVATIGHERDHLGIARQYFYPEGPFAILPLTGRHSSVVWALPSERADEVLNSSQETFRVEFGRRLGNELGSWDLCDSPLAFGLTFSLAKRMTSNRVALVGDAVRTVHPIAGQGLNLALRDASALAEAISEQARFGLDCGNRTALENYQNMRRFDSSFSALSFHSLNWLFSKGGAMRTARALGMGIINRSDFLKQELILEAAGDKISPPLLMSAEA